MKKKSTPKMAPHPITVEVQEVMQDRLPSPHAPLTPEQLKEAVLEAYNRHLKRACGHKVNALDMTFHFLKHMGYNEVDWDRMVKIMVVMKEEIDGKSNTPVQ